MSKKAAFDYKTTKSKSRGQERLQHGGSGGGLPPALSLRGEGARFALLRDKIGYSFCTLFTANASLKKNAEEDLLH